MQISKNKTDTRLLTALTSRLADCGVPWEILLSKQTFVSPHAKRNELYTNPKTSFENHFYRLEALPNGHLA